MYSNILVPVVLDHGDQGATSLRVAQKLLNPGGTITLMNVLEEIPSYASHYIPADIAERNRQEAIDGLRQMAEDNDAAAEIAVIRGHASSSILDYGKNKGVDCIVIASHKPGLEDYFLGSTAARVVRHAPCGVHVLR